jgi:hypothetical protein
MCRLDLVSIHILNVENPAIRLQVLFCPRRLHLEIDEDSITKPMELAIRLPINIDSECIHAGEACKLLDPGLNQ